MVLHILHSYFKLFGTKKALALLGEAVVNFVMFCHLKFIMEPSGKNPVGCICLLWSSFHSSFFHVKL